MDARIKKLEKEHNNAMRHLKKTLDQHDKADEIEQRKMRDEEFKNTWLNY